MRTVAKFQLSTAASDEAAAWRISEVLDRWLSRKFRVYPDGRWVIRRSGLEAKVDRVKDKLDDIFRDKLNVEEAISGGYLRTEVNIIGWFGRIIFNCTLGVASENGLAPPEVQISAPKFVKDTLGLPLVWTIGAGGERVFAQHFDVGADDLDDFVALMESSFRRLPLVVVSELNGETLAGDLHDKLGSDLCAVAHVVRLTADAALSLSRRVGKEWSCYNGAVRLFWPFGSNRTDFRSHPLWTRDQQLSGYSDEVDAREGFRRRIGRRIIEASTFISDDAAFSSFEAKKLRRQLDQSRVIAQAQGDFESIADSYAKENDALRIRVDDLVSENAALSQNVETLASALRATPNSRPTRQDDLPPETVIDAVTIARRDLSDSLLIAVETDDDLLGLRDGAGPPEKILRYLRILAEMSEVIRNRGSLGKSVPSWLKERNVDCSIESESGRNNKESLRFRTRMINGMETECGYHAKPSDGVSPDMCVRIYFALSDQYPHVRVGYIGRHAV